MERQAEGKFGFSPSAIPFPHYYGCQAVGCNGRILLISLRGLSARILKSISFCKFNQNFAELPKYLDSLKAVSTVIFLFPFSISNTVVVDIFKSFARRYAARPNGSRNSSFKISPTVGVGIRFESFTFLAALLWGRCTAMIMVCYKRFQNMPPRLPA